MILCHSKFRDHGCRFPLSVQWMLAIMEHVNSHLKHPTGTTRVSKPGKTILLQHMDWLPLLIFRGQLFASRNSVGRLSWSASMDSTRLHTLPCSNSVNFLPIELCEPNIRFASKILSPHLGNTNEISERQAISALWPCEVRVLLCWIAASGNFQILRFSVSFSVKKFQFAVPAPRMLRRVLCRFSVTQQHG